jgi:hypothetical protein
MHPHRFMPMPPSGQKPSKHNRFMPPPVLTHETKSKFTASDINRIANKIKLLNEDIQGFKKTLTDKTKQLNELTQKQDTDKWKKHDIQSIETYIDNLNTQISESESELDTLKENQEYERYLIAEEHKNKHGVMPIFAHKYENPDELPLKPHPPRSKNPGNRRTLKHVYIGGKHKKTRKHRKSRSRK